jgi:hypothetical protein
MCKKNLAGRATTDSGSGYDKIRVGYDKIRVWLRQNQGLATTKSGSGYDRFRVKARQIQGLEFTLEIASPEGRENEGSRASASNRFAWNCGLEDLYEQTQVPSRQRC